MDASESVRRRLSRSGPERYWTRERMSPGESGYDWPRVNEYARGPVWIRVSVALGGQLKGSTSHSSMSAYIELRGGTVVP